MQEHQHKSYWNRITFQLSKKDAAIDFICVYDCCALGVTKTLKSLADLLYNKTFFHRKVLHRLQQTCCFQRICRFLALPSVCDGLLLWTVFTFSTKNTHSLCQDCGEVTAACTQTEMETDTEIHTITQEAEWTVRAAGEVCESVAPWFPVYSE